MRPLNSPLADSRQACGGDRLAMALFLFIRDMETDLIGYFGELNLQHILRTRDDNVASGPRSNPAEYQYIFQIIEICKMRDGIAQIRADGFIDLTRSGISLLHELLHVLELFRQRHLGIHLDACRRQQPRYTLLGKILHVAPVIAGPFVRWGGWIVI